MRIRDTFNLCDFYAKYPNFTIIIHSRYCKFSQSTFWAETSVYINKVTKKPGDRRHSLWLNYLFKFVLLLVLCFVRIRVRVSLG